MPAETLVDYGTFEAVGPMKIHLMHEGEGKPIILIHGFTASLYTWRFNIPKLGEEFSVYALDLPGFGYSDKPLDFDYTLDGYAKFITDFMDAKGIKKATIVGNSMGGGVAIKVATLFPDRVEKLVLIDSMGYPSESHFLPFTLMGIPVIGDVLMSLNYRAVVEKSLTGGVYYDNSFVTDEVVDAYYNVYATENAKKTPLIVIRTIFNAYPITGDEIKSIAVPTLVLWGQSDNLIPVADSAAFGMDIGGACVVTYPEAGHMPQEEKADLVNNAIANFVKDGACPSP